MSISQTIFCLIIIAVIAICFTVRILRIRLAKRLVKKEKSGLVFVETRKLDYSLLESEESLVFGTDDFRSKKGQGFIWIVNTKTLSVYPIGMWEKDKENIKSGLTL